MQKYQRDIQVFPSLLCGDLYNIERTANDLFKSGYRNIHVDILDGHFSPSVKAKLFCPEIAGLFCRIAGLFCHDSRANLSLKPVCFGIAIS